MMIVAMARYLSLALLLTTGCVLDSMLEEGRACSPAHPCATGYVCSAAGRCARPARDHAIVDTAPDARGLSLDPSVDRPADLSRPDAPRPDGLKCSTDSECPWGLNCVTGQCRCVAGFQKACSGGCCASNVSCIPAASQSASQCGTIGMACKSCDDSNPCTTDKCTSSGLCSHGAASGPACTYCDDAGCRAGVCSTGVCFPQG